MLVTLLCALIPVGTLSLYITGKRSLHNAAETYGSCLLYTSPVRLPENPALVDFKVLRSSQQNTQNLSLIHILCDAGDAEPMKGCMPGKSSGYCSAETSDGLPGVEPGHVNTDG